MRYVASVSFGKDSLAMLLLILEKKLPLDEVVFYDTGAEFDCIYEIRDRVVKEYLKPRGIEYTELKPSTGFFDMMFDKEVKHRDGTTSKGYSWCGGACRWGTTYKTRAIDRHVKGCRVYVGIAADEHKRIRRIVGTSKLIPLVDFRMSELACLDYCYQNGFDWNEDGVPLYDILDRVSCWCCANKNKKELLAYYRHLPKYWEKLKALQAKTDRPFKKDKTIFDFEKEFKEQSDE